MAKYFTLYILLLFGLYGHSQLSDFILTVTVTDETCFGNGGLAFSVSGTEPGATIIYEVYKLPNTTTPIVTSTGIPVTGLTSGSYNVTAIQSLGGNIGTQTVEVVIADLTDPLTFFVHSEIICPDEGIITVNILTGTAATYQIVSGPDNFSTPPQASNIFTGLQPGLYSIGVQDASSCGDFITQNNQIVYTPLSPVVFTELVITSPELDSCGENSITVLQYIETSTDSFPLTVTFTTYPPDGSAPIVQTQIVTEGLGLLETIPFYIETYFFDIEVTNVCGATYSRTNIPVHYNIEITGSYSQTHCYAMYIFVGNFIGNYTIEFDFHPAGFDPELFNANHPGPYTESEIFYGIDPSGELIEGNYQVTVTDACGRTATSSFTIHFPTADQDPIFSFIPDPPNPPECDCTGEFIISSAYGLGTAIIVDAPSEYVDYLTANNLSLPYDISDFIGDAPENSFLIFPINSCGEYTVIITDVCGNEYVLNENMSPPSFDAEDLTAEQAPGCNGLGSIMITSYLNEDIIGKIEAIHITNAPNDFYELFNGTQGEIYDATDYAYFIPGVSDTPSIWYIGMNGLPAGNYDFNIQFGCEFIPFSYTIEAYQQTTTIDLEEMCGAFNLFFEHTANNNTIHFSPYLETYWVEKYNEATEEWEYIDISSDLKPNQITYNIYHLGSFRIVKQYPIWNNGTVIPPESTITFCVEPIYEFEFTGTPKINGVAYFPCPNGENEIFVDASGTAPLLYEITEKDNHPFYINNGENNMFTGLEQGVYNFRVTDSCGNIVNGTYQINQPFDFDITATPLCNNQQGSLYTNYFPFLNYQWWHSTNPNDILSTSHQLFFEPFNIDEDSGTYYLNISYSDNPNSCINQTLTYEINLTPPNAGNDETVVYCSSGGENIDLFSFLTSEYDAFGIWEDLSQTGALQDNILAVGNLLPGTYEFGYSVNTCEGADESVLTLILLNIPEPPVIIGVDSVCIGSNVQLSVENPNLYYTYIWTYPDGTVHTGESILITEIDIQGSDVYIVTASIANPTNQPNTCTAYTTIDVQTNYCEIPKGISPNGDGLNDFFDLSDFNVEKLKIFNRYGRMVYEAKNGYTNEWHGQSSVNNDRLLPTATYYYVVTFRNGNIKTGWVYLLREE